MATAGGPRVLYRRRAAEFGAVRDALAARSRRIAWTRIGVVLAMTAPLVAGLSRGTEYRSALLMTAAALAVAFIVLVVLHSRVEEEERWNDALHRVNADASARVERRWDVLPGHHATADPNHAYAGDLDLFGRASLFQLLEISTDPGDATLARWLLEPSLPVEVPERQAAVQTLAGLLDLRHALAAHGRLAGERVGIEMARFVDWALGPSWLLEHAWLIWVARIVTASLLGLIAAHAAGAIETPLWIGPLLVSVALVAFVGPHAHHAFHLASGPEGVVRRYAALFATAEGVPRGGPLLDRLGDDLQAGGAPAHAQMARLNAILTLADFHLSAAIIAFPVNLLTLWDLHVWDLLERWRRRSGPHVGRWAAALGEVDALCALAGLAYDHADWVFPQVGIDGTGDKVLRADSLGHPLLSDAERVVNDVEIGPTGTFLLVTGSNMSGKSTLLRAIGLNVVLAQAGGPVCARRFTLPPVALQTNMRITDSLEQGLSYFMAALKRLQAVIEAARAHHRGPRTALYLLDEILQGTNTAERQVAVRLVMRHLLRMGAIGAITSHDLTLAATPELAAASRPVHFSETVEEGPEGPVMRFDYRLRPGIATSTNALRLMKMIGLDVD